MINLSNIAEFFAEPAVTKFLAAMAISTISGVVRGFSGFGSALVYIPLIAAIYRPQVAAATLVLIDFVIGVPFAIRATRGCNWQEIITITIGATFGVPFGTLALLHFDADVLRWVIGIFVLLVLGLLSFREGIRYHGLATRPAAFIVGIISGFFGGAIQMDGPAVVIFWLSGVNVASVVRANSLIFIALNSATISIAYALSGLINLRMIIWSRGLGIPFGTGMVVGGSIFRGSSERTYRNVASLIITLAALAILPIFDGWQP